MYKIKRLLNRLGELLRNIFKVTKVIVLIYCLLTIADYFYKGRESNSHYILGNCLENGKIKPFKGERRLTFVNQKSDKFIFSEDKNLITCTFGDFITNTDYFKGFKMIESKSEDISSKLTAKVKELSKFKNYSVSGSCMNDDKLVLAFPDDSVTELVSIDNNSKYISVILKYGDTRVKCNSDKLTLQGISQFEANRRHLLAGRFIKGLEVIYSAKMCQSDTLKKTYESIYRDLGTIISSDNEKLYISSPGLKTLLACKLSDVYELSPNQ